MPPSSIGSPDQTPALSRLTYDVRFRCFALSMQRVEVLLEPFCDHPWLMQVLPRVLGDGFLLSTMSTAVIGHGENEC